MRRVASNFIGGNVKATGGGGPTSKNMVVDMFCISRSRAGSCDFFNLAHNKIRGRSHIT